MINYLKVILLFLVFNKSYSIDTALVRLKPVNDFVLKTYFYSSNKNYPYYKFYNSNGDFLIDGWNSFYQFNGYANVIKYFNLNYRLQFKNFDYVYFNYLNFGYRNNSFSFTYGLDSAWIGHGYHGSLMLSNNATPFRLIRFQTERPIKIPFVGFFTYRFIHGWLDNFKVVAHRFSYLPVKYVEFGLNQTIVYQRRYKLWEFFKVFTAAEENIPSQKYDNDQRASLDVAFHLDFLNEYIPFFKKGKVYFEYGGEDLFAWWQKEDKVWIGPLGFEFFDPAQSYGVQLNFTNSKFCFEYSQNYFIINLFRNVHVGESYQNLTKKWYRKVPFIKDNFFVGHHMGSESSDIFLEYLHQFRSFNFRLFYHSERHGFASSFGTVYNSNPYPETLSEYGIELGKFIGNLGLSVLFISSSYKNVDVNPELLEYIIQKDSRQNTNIIGVKVIYNVEN